MDRRITIYEAAMAEAVAAGGETARQPAIAAFEMADSVFRLIHRLRKYGTPTFGFLGLLLLTVQFLGWAFNGFTREYFNFEPTSAGLARAAVLLGLALACLSVWDIAILFEKVGLVPGRLIAPALAAFHAIRDECAEATAADFDHNGLTASEFNERLFKHEAAILPGTLCDMMRRNSDSPMATFMRLPPPRRRAWPAQRSDPGGHRAGWP